MQLGARWRGASIGRLARCGIAIVLLSAAAALALFALPARAAADPAKVLRIASPDIETLDPQQYNDDPSFQVVVAIFEPLYEWGYLASPPQLAPVTAAALPAISADGKTWTMRVKPGIYFTDDTSFRGKPRELIADDYVYSYKRWLDPNGRRGGAPVITDLVVGARPVIDAAKTSGKFDFDRPIDGLRALDRYTVQLKLNAVDYPVIEDFINVGAVAREVVEAAGDDVRTRAVGTGPFRVREWQRGSRLVLEANPKYRALRFPESAAPAQAALVKSMQGKTLPQISVVEINFMDEEIPRLLLFEKGDLDYVILGANVATRLLQNNKLKPEYAARGIARHVFPEPFLFCFYFNIADPNLGGMTNERIALRRAIALAIDQMAMVDVLYSGQALPANQIVPPGVGGHDPTLPSKSAYDPAGAQALLDHFGYKMRTTDGYRTAPDGKPLTITMSLRTGGITRELQTLVKKDLDAIGIRIDFHVTPFQEVIKELQGGRFQTYWGGYGGQPSGYPELWQLYSRQPQAINVTHFKLDAYDRAMEQFLQGRTNAEQVAAARTMTDLARTYVPLLPGVFRLENDFVQPWLQGFSPQIFRTYWKYMDVDVARRRSGK
jgi:oligopeptide transport system substrate-binding protein